MSQKKEKKRKQLFYLFLIFLLILSVSFIFMPFSVGTDGYVNPLVYLAGACFWIGLIGTIVTAIKINVSRKSDSSFQESHADVKRLGLTHFCMNGFAVIADISMVITFIGFIISQILVKSSVITFILISLFVFSFGMHCMLNGINYIYINVNANKKKRRE